jgi:hypothetical protein
VGRNVGVECVAVFPCEAVVVVRNGRLMISHGLLGTLIACIVWLSPYDSGPSMILTTHASLGR